METVIFVAIGAFAFLTAALGRSSLVWRAYALLQPALGFPFFYDWFSQAGVSGERIFVVAAAAGTLARTAALNRPWRTSHQAPVIGLLLLQAIGALIIRPAGPPNWTLLLGSALRITVFICVMLALRSNEDIRGVIRAGAISAIVAACCSVVFLLFIGDMAVFRGRTFIDLYAKEPVAPSLFDGVARAGAGNLLGLVLVVALWKNQKKLIWEVLTFLSIVLIIAMLVAPLRRDVFVMFPIAAAVWFALGYRSGMMFFTRVLIYLLLFGLAALGAAFLMALLSPAWEDRLMNETPIAIEEGTIDPRVQLLLMTPAAIADAPIFGHGDGSYTKLTLRYYPGIIPNPEGITPHNGWSKIGVENGLPALFVFTFLLATIGIGCLHGCFRFRIHLLKVASVLFVVLCLQNFFGSFVDSTAWWFWLAVAGSASARAISRSQTAILDIRKKPICAT